MKYRRRVQEVDAIKYTGANADEVMVFVDRGELPRYGTGTQLVIPIGGNTGVMIVAVGEYILKHPDGTLSALDETKFNKLYEASE